MAERRVVAGGIKFMVIPYSPPHRYKESFPFEAITRIGFFSGEKNLDIFA